VNVGDDVPGVASFVDQAGRPFAFAALRGSDVVLAFIYTRCQDPHMCPLISSKFNALQRHAGARKLHLVEVTLDPSYDRPPVLARYARAYDADPARWTLVTGDAQPVLDFAARFGITAFPAGDAGIVHSENTVLIGPDGRVVEMIPNADWQPDAVLADLDAARAAAGNPWARVRVWFDRTAAAWGTSVDLVVALIACAALAYLLFRFARAAFAKHA
jgi:protein SCO1/2